MTGETTGKTATTRSLFPTIPARLHHLLIKIDAPDLQQRQKDLIDVKRCQDIIRSTTFDQLDRQPQIRLRQQADDRLTAVGNQSIDCLQMALGITPQIRNNRIQSVDGVV
jgi:hypothetical protein